MSEPWEIFQRAWDHGFNIGYLQGYIPFIFILNRYYYFSSRGVNLEDVYMKLRNEGFFDWYLDRKVVTKNEKQKNYEVADILELIKISNEYIERNRRVYERLAAGIPTQSILDALMPELVNLYGDYIIQINQYESGESYITLAILVSNDYDISAHKLISAARQRLLEKYNNQYGDATLSIMEYQYNSIIDLKLHSSQAYAIRNGSVLWKRTDKRYILNTLIPELIHIYGDYIMQIVQYEASLADISLAILTRNDLDDYERALIYRQRQDIEQRYNDMYEAGTLTIIEYSYDPVANPEVHDPVADMLRGGETLWKREENKNE